MLSFEQTGDLMKTDFVDPDNKQNSIDVANDSSVPVFSAIIPAYNAASHIAETLNSVFAQTVDSYEIIVINDGSQDTADLERELEPYLERVIYISRANGGPAAARNTGILKAKGEYIAFLDSDDQWVPEHLAMVTEVFKQDSTIDLVYGDALHFGDVTEGRTTMERSPSEGLATFESLVLGRCTVVGSTVVVRRKALMEAGLFDESFMHGEDFDLWARLAYRGGRIDYQRSVHALRRIHKGNLTADDIATFQGQARVLRKLIRELDLPRSLKCQIEREVEKCYAEVALVKCKQNLVEQRYKEAVRELQFANVSFRSRKLTMVIYLLRTVPQLVRRMYLKQI
jgi:glycosyltransferase involved in cell wall biosynthesis